MKKWKCLKNDSEATLFIDFCKKSSKSPKTLSKIVDEKRWKVQKGYCTRERSVSIITIVYTNINRKESINETNINRKRS